MSTPTDWWIKFSVARYLRDGVATLLSGPCVAHPDRCEVTAQRLVGDWVETPPRFTPDAQHPRMSLDPAVGLKLYEQAAAMQVAVVPPAVWGIDGETYFLEFGAGFNVVTFQWFMEPPGEWHSLASIASALESLGEECLAHAA